MKPIIAALLMAVLVAPASAQLTVPPRTFVEVVDPANVIIDRGAKLEIFPTQRATPLLDAQHHTVVHQLTRASSDSPIGATRLGVVFNHSMQQRGFVTGEIAFLSMSGSRPSDVTASGYPGLKRITASGVYVVKADTPMEFIALMKKLQARTDLKWVEPTITYGSLNVNPEIQ